MITITKELIEQGLSRRGGLNGKQIKVLGVESIRNNKGWLRGLYGTLITEQQKKDFLALKNKHLYPKHPRLL